MNSRSRLLQRRTFCATLLFALFGAFRTARGGALRTVQRTIHSYAYGDRTYTCLAIDGGIVPLILPKDAMWEQGSELKMVWPKERSFVTFRAASPREVALLNMIDRPEAPVNWKRYLADIIGDDSDQYAVRDFQTDILAVNHWRIGMMSMDYSLLGVRSCGLLLLWRCQDGSTITVIMRTGFTDYKLRCQELYALIGGAMIMAE